ncbi:hypothetical protein [Asaia spathodeae]|uniref:P-type conjugative transfer protein TrbJ n=1 Tax=Asaia spathodeae TaxID=657016 RepID=A0ABX2P8C9_9PROT|nr:hypothetical protein [Asaia spathodeae]GBR16761.1 hypothetical protein AA105894_1652 [Asaia spathodeae NBRC 105894]
MRHALLIALTVSTPLIWLGMSSPAHAQIMTVCPTCTQEINEATRWITQLRSMAAEIETVKSVVMSDIQGVKQITNLSSLQGLTSGNLDGVLNRLQSGLGKAQQLNSLPQTLSNDAQTMSNQLSTLKSLLSSIQSQNQSDAQSVQSIQGQIATTIGTHGAVQISNQLQAQIAQALIKVNQIEGAIAQQLATQAAIENDRENAADQAHNAMLVDQSSINVDAGGQY